MAAAIDATVKAAAIADLATGNALSFVAAKHGVSKATLSRWKNSPDMPVPTAPAAPVAYVGTVVPIEDGTIGTERNGIGTKKRREIGEQLYEYMQTSLTTLTVQLECFGDPDWIKAQPAGDLANLHGVIADKAGRLLAAYQQGLAQSGDDGD